MNPIIETMLNKRVLWQGRYTPAAAANASSGYRALDEKLQGGIPKQGVIEIQSATGIGEIRLLLPYLQKRHQQESRLLVCIAPPMLLNPPMLAQYGIELARVLVITPSAPKDALWAAEQCLQSGSCHSVILWQQPLAVHQVKRLQLAAQKGAALQVIMRPQTSDGLNLPTTLSLALYPQPEGITVEVRRYPGNFCPAAFVVPMFAQWPALASAKTPLATSNVVPFSRKLAR